MPIFEYKCNDCGFVMEFLEKKTGPPSGKYTCKKCKGTNLQRLLSGFSVGQSSNRRNQEICSSCPTGPCPTGTCPLS